MFHHHHWILYFSFMLLNRMIMLHLSVTKQILSHNIHNSDHFLWVFFSGSMRTVSFRDKLTDCFALSKTNIYLIIHWYNSFYQNPYHKNQIALWLKEKKKLLQFTSLLVGLFSYIYEWFKIGMCIGKNIVIQYVSWHKGNDTIYCNILESKTIYFKIFKLNLAVKKLSLHYKHSNLFHT